MLIANLVYSRVRLLATRVTNKAYEIKRFGSGAWHTVGEVKYVEGWHSRRENRGWAGATSFRTAILHMARIRGLPFAEIQVLGLVQAIRINVSDEWYTVLFHKRGSLLYEDHTIKDQRSAVEQRMLQGALNAAERYEREHL